MKKQFFKTAFAAAVIVIATQLTACKSKTKASAQDSVAVVDSSHAAPVVISPDEQLTKNVTDATKDFQGVTAKLDSGVVTLTGNITREKLQQLMMSLNALHPKKINNQLIISK